MQYRKLISKVLKSVDNKIPCKDEFYFNKERWIYFGDNTKLKVIFQKEDF